MRTCAPKSPPATYVKSNRTPLLTSALNLKTSMATCRIIIAMRPMCAICCAASRSCACGRRCIRHRHSSAQGCSANGSPGRAKQRKRLRLSLIGPPLQPGDQVVERRAAVDEHTRQLEQLIGTLLDAVMDGHRGLIPALLCLLNRRCVVAPGWVGQVVNGQTQLLLQVGPAAVQLVSHPLGLLLRELRVRARMPADGDQRRCGQLAQLVPGHIARLADSPA